MDNQYETLRFPWWQSSMLLDWFSIFKLQWLWISLDFNAAGTDVGLPYPERPRSVVNPCVCSPKIDGFHVVFPWFPYGFPLFSQVFPIKNDRKTVDFSGEPPGMQLPSVFSSPRHRNRGDLDRAVGRWRVSHHSLRGAASKCAMLGRVTPGWFVHRGSGLLHMFFLLLLLVLLRTWTMVISCDINKRWLAWSA